MTTATGQTITVPVRTWQEKAILAFAIAWPIQGLHEEVNTYLGTSPREHLRDPEATDRLLAAYDEQTRPIRRLHKLLDKLEYGTKPGPHVTFDVPADVVLLESLDDAIQALTDQHADGEQRENLEGAMVAITLREAVAGCDA